MSRKKPCPVDDTVRTSCTPATCPEDEDMVCCRDYCGRMQCEYAYATIGKYYIYIYIYIYIYLAIDKATAETPSLSLFDTSLLSHLLVAGCDIGVRFSIRPSVCQSVSPSINIYVDVRHLCQS